MATLKEKEEALNIEILEVVTVLKSTHTILVKVQGTTFYMFAEVVGNKIKEIQPLSLSIEEFESLSIEKMAIVRNFVAGKIQMIIEK